MPSYYPPQIVPPSGILSQQSSQTRRILIITLFILAIISGPFTFYIIRNEEYGLFLSQFNTIAEDFLSLAAERSIVIKLLANSTSSLYSLSGNKETSEFYYKGINILKDMIPSSNNIKVQYHLFEENDIKLDTVDTVYKIEKDKRFIEWNKNIENSKSHSSYISGIWHSSISQTISSLADESLAKHEQLCDTDAYSTVLYPLINSSHSDTIIAGYASVVFSWNDLLSYVAPKSSNGIDVVISEYPVLPSMEQQQENVESLAMFRIVDGQVVYRGSNDTHQLAYSEYRLCSQLFISMKQAKKSGFATSEPKHECLREPQKEQPSYRIDIYPSAEFRSQYYTSSPWIASIAVSIVTMVTALLLFAYDAARIKEVGVKDAVLDTKRRFVRFISHEVRTPLNTVMLGLQVLVQEQKKLLQTLMAVSVAEMAVLSKRHTPKNDTKVNVTSVEMQAEASPQGNNVGEISDSNRAIHPSSDKSADSALLKLQSSSQEESNKEVSYIPPIRHTVTSSSDVEQILEDTEKTIVEWLELSDDLLGNSDTAVSVLDDLLNYDKIELGTFNLEFSFIRIWQLVQDIEAHVLLSAKAKSIELRFNVADCVGGIIAERKCRCRQNRHERFPSKRHVVLGDANRVSQILRNLVSNAIKHTPAGGKINVTGQWNHAGLSRQEDLPAVSTQYQSQVSSLLEKKYERAGSIIIAVRDSGVGLTEDQLSRVFGDPEERRFSTGKLDAGGTSELGLIITKGLVEHHGGRMWVSSDGFNKGCSFMVELPMHIKFPHPSRKRAMTTPVNKVVDSSPAKPNISSQDTSTIETWDRSTRRTRSAKKDEKNSFVRDVLAASREIKVREGSSSDDESVISLRSVRVQPTESEKVNNTEGTPSKVEKRKPVDDQRSDAATIDTADHTDADGIATMSLSSDSVSLSSDSIDSETLNEIVPRYRPALYSGRTSRRLDTTNGPKQVLIVDDAVSNRKMLRRLLQARGYSCHEAKDGLDALSVYKNFIDSGNMFDIILMDYEMPEMDGPTCTRELRLSMECGCLIFGVTGNVLPQDVKYFTKQGADKVLPKPLSIDLLEKTWDDYLLKSV